MAWSRFEPGFSRHPKRLKGNALAPVASWLWVCSVDHCTEFHTNGFIDSAAIPSLCPNIRGPELKTAITLLLEVKSWKRVKGGFIVHGYLDHNPSKDQVEADQRASRQRYQRWKDKRVSNAVSDDDQRRDNGAAATPTVSLSVSQSSNPSVGSPGNLSPSAQQTEKRWGLLADGQYRLHDGMFHRDCDDPRRWPPGSCVKSEWLRDVPTPKQCPKHAA